jgi:hypothetical protein
MNGTEWDADRHWGDGDAGVESHRTARPIQAASYPIAVCQVKILFHALFRRFLSSRAPFRFNRVRRIHKKNGRTVRVLYELG